MPVMGRDAGRDAMVSRRKFVSLVAGGIAAPAWSSAKAASNKVALYANVGADLTRYDVDIVGANLTKRETVTLPAAVQYAWPHASRRYLYVASSSSAGLWHRRDRASRHRVSHRSGKWRPHPARGTDTAADAPHSHEHGHSVTEYSGRVQQPERGPRLPHQQGLYAGRGSEAAGPDRRRHLRPSGARDARQPAGDPGDLRERSHPHQAGRPRCAESLQLQ